MQLSKTDIDQWCLPKFQLRQYWIISHSVFEIGAAMAWSTNMETGSRVKWDLLNLHTDGAK